MSSYFSYFPTLMYSDTPAVNIIAKVKFDESVSRRLANFYPYTLEEGERADQVAETYYEDSSLDWVVYLSNGIIDPYHEWHKSGAEFDLYIKTKYGSAANADLQTAFYRTDFAFDDAVISPAAYTALSTNLKQYWSPIIGYNDTVINYERRANELVTDTNLVLSLTGTFGSLNEHDIIKQSSGAMGTVGFANSTQAVIKHVTGTWAANTPVTYALSGSSIVANISAVTTISQPISPTEVPYWSAVSQLSVEHENNEATRTIRLLNSTYVDVIERDMRDLLSV